MRTAVLSCIAGAQLLLLSHDNLCTCPLATILFESDMMSYSVLMNKTCGLPHALQVHCAGVLLTPAMLLLLQALRCWNRANQGVLFTSPASIRPSRRAHPYYELLGFSLDLPWCVPLLSEQPIT
jgi:hypothetical protein